METLLPNSAHPSCLSLCLWMGEGQAVSTRGVMVQMQNFTTGNQTSNLNFWVHIGLLKSHLTRVAIQGTISARILYFIVVLTLWTRKCTHMPGISPWIPCPQSWSPMEQFQRVPLDDITDLRLWRGVSMHTNHGETNKDNMHNIQF